jgi:kynureninase
MPYHRLLTEHTAELVGAKPIEVVVMNSLTVNLHLMMVSFYRPTPERHRIVVERGAFPSDQYAIQSQIRFHGFDPATSLIELTPLAGETCLREEEIE